jgi:hypothetical protein
MGGLKLDLAHVIWKFTGRRTASRIYSPRERSMLRKQKNLSSATRHSLLFGCTAKKSDLESGVIECQRPLAQTDIPSVGVSHGIHQRELLCVRRHGLLHKERASIAAFMIEGGFADA